MDQNDTTMRLRTMLAHLGRVAAGRAQATTGALEKTAAPLAAAVDLKARLSADQWTAVGQLMDGKPIGQQMHDQLFSIVREIGRPAVVVENGDFVVGQPWSHFTDPPIHAILVQALRAVGRIEIPGDAVYPLAGTGFLVGERLVMTNRHVVAAFTIDLGTPRMRLRDGMAPVIDFHQEFGAAPGDVSGRVAIEAVTLVLEDWDMALVRLAHAPHGITPLTLARTLAPPKSEMAVLGYPSRSAAPDHLETSIYHDIYDVKRMLPGQIGRMGHSAAAAGPVLTHDSSTLSGSSGSALLDAATGLVIGLHFEGNTMNYAVPSSALAAHNAVLAQGVQFA